MMGKRTLFDADVKGAQVGQEVKRQRIEGSHGDEVTTARDLQRALLFDQRAHGDFRSGLNMFKRFLDSILYTTEAHHLPRQRAILREYLDSQKGKGNDAKDTLFLQNLIQAWDFAAETNFEAILAHVTAVLALLLKVLASHSELTAYGTLLAKTILQPSVARRLVRSTSAAPNHENIISPALRLLTELTRFNEGAHARAVYAKRDFTLEPKILARNIGLRREQSAADHKKKPSVRTTAIRYLLMHLRYQDERAKSEILSNVNIVRGIFDHLSADPPFLIFEVFDVFKSHVFQDKTLARSTKSRILSGKALSRIASLYSYEVEEGSQEDGQKTPAELAHDFLRMVCTDPAYGVMLPNSGFYPSTFEDDDADLEDPADKGIDLGLDSVETRSGKVRNVILSEFILSQRPYANTLQQELVLDIFNACPELVVDYFTKRKDFSYDPKLTSTWIGYSAFLYQTIQLPVPKYLGGKRGFKDHPPSVSAIMQSILPQPLNQQVLTKCLNHNSDLVQLFAIRVLIAALQKLQNVVHVLGNANMAKSSKYWEQASKRLTTEISRRCPPIKTVLLALKKPGLKAMKRESITRLLKLYYEVTPQVALQEKFDVSLPLCNALAEAEKLRTSTEDKVFRVMELEHWIQMAKHSPAMRWWQKPKTLAHSPFVTLLRLLVTSQESELYAGIRPLLGAILQDQDMLQTQTSPDALDALTASLGASPGSSVPSNEVLGFLDDCCSRFIKAPIKYFDDIDAMCARGPDAQRPFTPLLMTFIEQWPFRGGEAATSGAAEPIAQWLSKLLYLLKLIGEDETMLTSVRDALVESAAEGHKQVLKDAFLWKMGKESAKEALKLATGADFSGSERSVSSPSPPTEADQNAVAKPSVDLEALPEEDEKHTGLTRWKKKDLSEAIDDGDVGQLLLCLCSKHPEIRLQAINNIRQLMATLDASVSTTVREDDNTENPQKHTTNADLQQLYLLLGETLESVEQLESDVFPYIGGVLAARCAGIVADPTHSMYSKISRFLTKAPAWSLQHLFSEFWHSIVASEPDEDGTYHQEVDWLLEYLLESLRTPQDMEYFRKSNIIEQLLGHYSSRSCAVSAKEKILRLLLRATHVDGSTTLITRCGLLPWVQMMLDNQDPRQRTLKTLAWRVYETCDRERVDEWSSGAIGQTMAALA
ncbi:ribosome 60S biogenesis N-terminal-domain-containing protein [Ampelomyces quisqualis]|uniref:Ribosome 60S biogenesis N-terminal-domain-containing protein n=1 Tax=Ampelomyces quisqualis TaxID=50730 RepID=A0A6A5QW93_AMPQU|nr:ribosome 60S biogenesis N-terminal-domain-containing protein [Ampelomyces quisqualis]